MPSQLSTSRKITQELDRLQREITTKLERYYKQNVKGKQTPVDFIRQNDKQIKGIIRDTIQASWLFAHGIISDTIADRVDLTVKDIQGIELTTNDMENYFWALSHDLLTRETEYKIDKTGQLEQLEPFAVHAAFIGLGGWFAYYAYNYAMESKAQELGNIKLKFVTRENCIDTKICLPLNGKIFDIGTAQGYQPPLHRHCRCRFIPIRV
jgi:hypothetical protein